MRSSVSSRGAVRFDVMATVVLIFVLAGVLLDRLDAVQCASERTVVEMEVAAMRTELQLAIASHVIRGEDAQLAGWEGRNPAELAWGGAHGEPAVGGAALTGSWRWSAAAGVLSYTYRGGECLQLRLRRVQSGEVDGWSLGGGLLLAPQYKEKNC